jgi:hypothetical protein
MLFVRISKGQSNATPCSGPAFTALVWTCGSLTHILKTIYITQLHIALALRMLAPNKLVMLFSPLPYPLGGGRQSDHFSS